MSENSSKLEKALAELNKEYGKGSVFNGDTPIEGIEEIEVISTGSFGLDRATGVGGFPTGRIVEIFGPESSGKTTICLQVVANTQKKGFKAAIIDMEHALDKKYARALGVDFSTLLFSQPDDGEQALNIARKLIETDEVKTIVVDSVAALVPQTEAEGDIGDSNVGKQARLIAQAMRVLTPLVAKHGVLLLFTNQLRMKIGVMFGSPETTAGGEALKFFASMRVDIRKSILKDGKEAVANTTRIKIVKNKVAAPFGQAEFIINWGEGVNRIEEVIQEAHNTAVLKIWGGKIAYKDEKVEKEIFVQRIKDGIIPLEEIESQIPTKKEQGVEELDSTY